MHTYRALRLLRADRRGSSWPVVLATEAGPFHTKLLGAAQAPAALVAEIVVGALADALGLAVPARVLVDIPPDMPRDDLNDELAQLCAASVGRNLGFQLLDGARDFRAEDAKLVSPELASTIVWLDGLVENPDRTASNPNLLWVGDTLFLIDHGAALAFQHDLDALSEDAPRRPNTSPRPHVLAARATRVAQLDERLARALPRATLEAAVLEVPDEYFWPLSDADAIRRRRALFVAYLWKRLLAPRPFVDGARALTD